MVTTAIDVSNHYYASWVQTMQQANMVYEPS